jgi:hypothetical protein
MNRSAALLTGWAILALGIAAPARGQTNFLSARPSRPDHIYLDQAAPATPATAPAAPAPARAAAAKPARQSGARASGLNAYRAGTALPDRLRRVAVLPLTTEVDLTTEAGAEALAPVWLAELARTRAFEVVPVTADWLLAATGRRGLSAADELPLDLLPRLVAATGCDGVLFCRLTQYRASPPLLVGWSAKLVSADGRQVVWAVDETFDAGDPRVRAAARVFARQRLPGGQAVADPAGNWLAPRQFGQYALQAVLATLPAR